jgi:MFS family permease
MEKSNHLFGNTAVTAQLIPFVIFVFLGFLTIGITTAALPLQISHELGYGSVIVGITVSLQSITTLITRAFAGRLSDSRGGKYAVFWGMIFFIAAGLNYTIAIYISQPLLSLIFFSLGRMCAGFGESALITGSLAWSINVVGPSHVGLAMVWVGIAMFAALALGAPIGLELFNATGFFDLAIIAIIAPLIALIIVIKTRQTQFTAGRRLPFTAVVQMIWKQGLGLMMASIGYGSMTAFTSLFYKSMNWDGAGYALSAFAGAYILARFFFGHLPDQIGGKWPAIIFSVCEFVGLIIVALAPNPYIAITGAFLAGAGFSMVFPSLGAIAIIDVPPASRGAALGAYVAFLDMGIGVAGPLFGEISSLFGYPAAYITAACAALVVIFAARL